MKYEGMTSFHHIFSSSSGRGNIRRWNDVEQSYEDLSWINEIAVRLSRLPPEVCEEISGPLGGLRNRAEIVADWYFDALSAKAEKEEEEVAYAKYYSRCPQPSNVKT